MGTAHSRFYCNKQNKVSNNAAPGRHTKVTSKINEGLRTAAATRQLKKPSL